MDQTQDNDNENFETEKGNFGNKWGKSFNYLYKNFLNPHYKHSLRKFKKKKKGGGHTDLSESPVILKAGGYGPPHHHSFVEA